MPARAAQIDFLNDSAHRRSQAGTRVPLQRVLVLTSLYPNRDQPVFGNFVRERIRRLGAAATIQVLAPVRYRWRTSSTIPYREERDGLVVHHPRFTVIPRICKWSDGLLFGISILTAFRRLRRTFDPQLIDAHWGYPDGFAAYLLGRWFGLPVVVTVRGSDVNLFMRETLRGWLMRRSLARVERIIAVSDALRRSLEQHGIPPHKIAVIRNGVDTEQFAPREQAGARRTLGLDPQTQLILFVGNLVPIKGPDVLIEAFARLRDNSARLVYIGAGAMREALMRRVRELPESVATRISFAGAQAHATIPVWLAAADVLCLPSRNEGLPNVAIEAMACGRPVVAARVGGVEEVIVSQEFGLTVPSEDPEALRAALETALGRRWDAQAIRRHAERFSWDQTVHQCLELWQDVLTSYNRSRGVIRERP